MTDSLAPGDLAFVADLVRRQSANVLDATKGYLVEARLTPVARERGFASVSTLIAELRASRHGPLHELVVDRMTTNETSFFRDVRPFTVLERHVLPELIERRAAQRSLTIWSAACSSGQEPYTIAMLLRDRFPQVVRDWNVRIVASDLSSAMLARAAAGRFSQLEVNRGLPAPMLVRYFSRVGTEWQISDEIRQMIEFRAINLVQPWPFLPMLDVVFLRNVLIYVDVPTKQVVLDRVRQVLRPDGSLFLGAAETTLNLDDRFERCSQEQNVLLPAPATRSMTMGISTHDVRQITEEIFAAVLGLAVLPGGVEPPEGGRVVTGMVQITGDWRGAVAIELVEPLARRATAIMFGMDETEVTAADIRDTVGEIANMSGGNVKSLVGGSCQLSLPSVTEGVEYEVSVPGARVTQVLGFRCGDELLRVSILEQR